MSIPKGTPLKRRKSTSILSLSSGSDHDDNGNPDEKKEKPASGNDTANPNEEKEKTGKVKRPWQKKKTKGRKKHFF